MKTHDIAEQAARWIEDARSGRVSSQAFMAWLKESPKHVEELLLVATIEGALSDFSHRSSFASLLQGADSKDSNVVPLATQTPTKPASRSHTKQWAWAAGLAAITLTTLTSFWMYPHSERTYTTHVGEQRTFELEDGSIVYLNTDSKLTVAISTTSRDLRLIEGEALFDVERDPARPFRVLTREAVIQAVGTQFNVHRRDDRTSVAVIEGRVNVMGDRLLGAGEEAQISVGGQVKQKASDLERVVAWRERRLVFHNDSLADIAAEFNRYNRRQTIRVETEVDHRKFTGAFNADAPDSLAKALSEDAALEVMMDGNKITIRSARGER